MTEVAFRSDQIANALLEGLYIRKPAIAFAAPNEFAVQFDAKESCGRVIRR